MSEPTDPRISQAKAKDFGGPMIRVIFAPKGDDPISVGQVGKAQGEELWVPLNLLRSSSQFLKAATKPEWDDLCEVKRTITLSSDPMLFKAYVHWLYMGTIPRPDDNAPDHKDYPFLAKLYVLGEELLDAIFKNRTIDAIIAVYIKSKLWPIGETIRIIYEGTPEGSPARRLMADGFARIAYDHPSWMKEFKNCSHDFLVDVSRAMVSVRQPPSGKFLDDIDHKSYHESVPSSAP
ncbi:hypothetical protein P171DRAFT_444593 [Karstenula rhodostoma CBS 690.94]|uniref:BTB domain-containing protein n=1 Tax=Karstenula rhodostoma CBS 690.94 TaxID=1392251 RepID=A0A9P4PJE7_9PLEO|nr:hypothetical protein P171DRAFT_444593 [Karstenula rhodostoma CBS 690.94]